MTTYELEYAGSKLRLWGHRVKRNLANTVIFAAHEFRKGVPVAKAHFVDHAYSFAGIGLFDSAMFIHSLFTGLMVTGISLLALEWKIAAE